MKTSKENITVLALFAVLATTAVSAQTGLTLYDNADLNANGNSINNLSFLNPNGTNLKINASETNFTQENITGIQNINDFFNQTACDSNEAIKTVYPNGSYDCDQLTQTTQSENLSETLSAGNVANQSIDLNENSLENVSQLNPAGSNISLNSSYTNFGNNSLNNISNIKNFFNQSQCSSNEAVKRVYPNGSYLCTDIVNESLQTENLSETLEAGNVANQTLNLGSNPIEAVSKLNITNESSNTQIAAFEETGITLKQPLSVEADGPLSAANGIDLTDSTSNTIESYGTFYLSTSEGSPKDISLSPSGIVGVESNLSVTGNINMNGNNITEVNKISGDSDPVKISNDVEMTGPSPEIDLGNGMQVQRTGGNVVISD